MDIRRPRLIDVINDPLLLQSFLESGSDDNFKDPQDGTSLESAVESPQVSTSSSYLNTSAEYVVQSEPMEYIDGVDNLHPHPPVSPLQITRSPLLFHTPSPAPAWSPSPSVLYPVISYSQSMPPLTLQQSPILIQGNSSNLTYVQGLQLTLTPPNSVLPGQSLNSNNKNNAIIIDALQNPSQHASCLFAPAKSQTIHGLQTIVMPNNLAHHELQYPTINLTPTATPNSGIMYTSSQGQFFFHGVKAPNQGVITELSLQSNAAPVFNATVPFSSHVEQPSPQIIQLSPQGQVVLQAVSTSQPSTSFNVPHQMNMEIFESKPYRCCICSEEFTTTKRLSRHQSIHIMYSKKYRCKFCQKEYTQLSHLVQHTRTHTGEKPFKCREQGCDKVYSQMTALRYHSRTHRTDKPYKCKNCYYSFSDKMSLLEHIQKHKKSNHKKTYICQFCGKSYLENSLLEQHMHKHS